jgi:hypothetical protein
MNRSLVGVGALVVVVVMAVAAPFVATNMVENLDANEVMVIQSPIAGELTVHTEPGVKYQGFGTVTKYPRRSEYSFVREVKDGPKAGDATAKKLRFNDGGHADLSGAVSWEMPLSAEAILKIHRTFRSAEAVERQAVAKMIDSAVYLAGPLMSSTESSGERRAELVQYINDQAELGVYVTRVVEKEITDPVTNVKKSVAVTEIVRDEKGQPKRQQGSILADFSINLLPMSITELKYDKVVEDQIAQRQKATTEVQIAQANAKRAEQDAITIAKQGEATAAKAKWEQETIKAKEVTAAQQKLEVATLAAKEAQQYKTEQILRGEGDAQRRAAVMNADGALDKKLETAIEINKVWAEAFSKYQGQMVPQINMGGGQNGSAMSGAQALVDMMTAKTAKELGVDFGVSGKGNTAAKK